MSYKFAGKQIRLNERDYDRWKKVYHAIPDFDAELQRIDDEELPPKWFPAVSAKLAAKHQKLTAQKSPAMTRPKEVSWDYYAQRVKQAFRENKRWLAPKNLTQVQILFQSGLITKDEADFCGWRT